jgi:hypothetical protein
MIAASCADYRAFAAIDLERDDAGFGKKVDVPPMIIRGMRSHTQTVFNDVKIALGFMRLPCPCGR